MDAIGFTRQSLITQSSIATSLSDRRANELTDAQPSRLSTIKLDSNRARCAIENNANFELKDVQDDDDDPSLAPVVYNYHDHNPNFATTAAFRPGYGTIARDVIQISTNHFKIDVTKTDKSSIDQASAMKTDLKCGKNIYASSVTIRSTVERTRGKAVKTDATMRKIIFHQLFKLQYWQRINQSIATDYNCRILSLEELPTGSLSHEVAVEGCKYQIGLRYLEPKSCYAHFKLSKYITRDPDMRVATHNVGPATDMIALLLSRSFTGPTISFQGHSQFLSLHDHEPWKFKHMERDTLHLGRKYHTNVVAADGGLLLRVHNKVHAMSGQGSLSQLLTDSNQVPTMFEDNDVNTALKSALKSTWVHVKLRKPKEVLRQVGGFGIGAQAVREKVTRRKYRDRRVMTYPQLNIGQQSKTKKQHLVVNVGMRKAPIWIRPAEAQMLPYQTVRCVPAALGLCVEALSKFSRLPSGGYASMVDRFGVEAISPTGEKKIHIDNEGTDITVQSSMISFKARVLPAPTIQYCNGVNATLNPESGSWKSPEGATGGYRRPYPKPFTIGFIHRSSKQDLQGVMESLYQKLRQFGLNPGLHHHTKLSSTGRTHVQALEDALEKLSNCDVIIFALKSIDRAKYNAFKQLCDLKYGKPSACMVLGNTGTSGCAAGVATKLNAKLRESLNHVVVRGRTSGVDIDLQKTMIIGSSVMRADAAKSFAKTPSIVALASCSIGNDIDEDNLCSYRGSVSLQDAKIEDRSADVIDNLQDLIKPHLNAYLKRHRELPDRIIYYRTGGDEGFLKYELKEFEVASIKQAYAAFRSSKEPKVTVVTVNRQEKVHFFRCDKPKASDASCPFGTVVDNTVTSPYYHDFFLQSHSLPRKKVDGNASKPASSVGTARPTHYIVAHDENNLSADAVQGPTFELCFASQAASQPLSQPVPTYYAQKLASRCRAWLGDYFEGELNEATGRELEVPEPADGVWAAKKDGFNKYLAEFPKPNVTAIQACYTRLSRHLRKGKAITEPWHEGLDGCMFWL